MENNNLCDLTLLSSFTFGESDSFKKYNNEKFVVSLDQEFITKYARLDESLQHVKTFYMYAESYCYNIVIPAKKGHKLYINKSNESEMQVFSTNYYEIEQPVNTCVKTKRK